MEVSLLALVFVIALLVFYRRRLLRVYRVVTLFKPDLIIRNFRSMGSFIETSPVRKGQTRHKFERKPQDLTATYLHEGKTKQLSEFLDATWTTGLVVLKDEAIAFEEYYRGNSASSKTISWSVAKSFVSALVGIAVEEGHLSIECPVTEYVPFLQNSGYDGVPIKDVLQMSSGVRFNEDYGDFFSDINRMGRAIAFDHSLDRFIVSLETERRPGTYNHYTSTDTQVLGVVLEAATGQTLTSYLETRIWQRIGMESDAYWLVDSQGRELAFGGLNVVLRDYARFGQLYLNEGTWDGEQVVPVEWVRASVTPDAPHLQPGENSSSDSVLGYGYQWWIPTDPEGDYLAIGVYNQFVYVHPSYQVVIAKSSAYPDYTIDGVEKELETIAVFRAIAKSLAEQ